MVVKFHRLTLNENAYKKFLIVKDRYYERHDLNKNVRISESDIFIDFFDTVMNGDLK